MIPSLLIFVRVEKEKKTISLIVPMITSFDLSVIAPKMAGDPLIYDCRKIWNQMRVKRYF